MAAVTVVGGFALFCWACYPIVPDDGEDSVRVQVDQQPHDATGFGGDSARVDSQLTFAVPSDQADAAYEYLRSTYVGEKDLLRDRFPQLQVTGQSMSTPASSPTPTSTRRGWISTATSTAPASARASTRPTPRTARAAASWCR